jgi:hypothetical protein
MRGSETGDWRGLLEVLGTESGYERRLDAALAYVRGLTQLPSCHLYLVDEEGGHLHLERSQGGAAPLDVPERDSDEPFLSESEELEGGAGTIAATPALDLPLTDADGLVATPAGRLYSMALRRNGSVVGLLQTGPAPGGSLPGRMQRRLEAIRFPLTVVVEQARREELLRRQLASVSARVEVGRRLQGSALELERFVGLLLSLALRATRT